MSQKEAMITIPYERYLELMSRSDDGMQRTLAIEAALELRRLVQDFIASFHSSNGCWVSNEFPTAVETRMSTPEFVEKAEEWLDKHRWYNGLERDHKAFIHETVD